MKVSVVAVGVLACIVSAAQAQFIKDPYFLSGNDLLDLCTGSPDDRSLCTGYVQGAVDQESARVQFDKVVPLFCVPAGVIVQQVIDITVRYLQNHPEQRQNVASGTVVNALMQVWPCP
jgi:hypothetical protein